MKHGLRWFPSGIAQRAPGELAARAAAFIALLSVIAPLAACSNSTQAAVRASSQARGHALIVKLGCGSCHEIPGIEGADGMVGPSLEHVASRQYLAGMLHNTPAGMVTWLRHPQRIVPGNAMPDLGISEADGRDIAAYLETLQ